jgi:predicted 3-demethylubiquinone-9 3-methyltransferase (glyoxalase superfamily)
MQKIVPHLWFDRDGITAAELYTSLFPNSRITSRSTISDTPSGTVETMSISLAGQDFALLSAGPEFKFTPAVSFLVGCETKAEVDRLRGRLLEGGSELMPLDAYPFSGRYAWVVDAFGLSWQLMYNGGAAIGQRIIPTLMFTGEQCGKAEEAVSFYASLFGKARIDHVLRYGPGEDPNGKDLVKHAAFGLEGQEFAAMDSALDHGSTFNEAISFMVYCDDQAEIDRYWGKLSAHPEAEQCGWLKDRYGLSWQIVPRALGRLMSSEDPARRARVTTAFLKMKKLDIAALEGASGG